MILNLGEGVIIQETYSISATDGCFAEHAGGNFGGEVGAHQDREPHGRVDLLLDDLGDLELKKMEF